VQVEWQPEARRDLIAILDYISDRNLGAAAALEARVMACVDRLPEFPALYRAGRVAETREAIVHPNYILESHFREEPLRLQSDTGFSHRLGA
jgi:toxin ParE1/3/4